MLYWSKEKVLGFSKHQPWAPELLKGSAQNKSEGTFTLKFRSPTSTADIEYELKVDPPLSSAQIIKGLSDLAEKRIKDKSYAKKVPSTPSRGKFSNSRNPVVETTTASITPPVSPVKEETKETSPSTPKQL